jgi:hypothetical protein
MSFKPSYPGAYGPSYAVKVPPETIAAERSNASGKAKARFPSTPLGPGQKNGEQGKMKRPAYTPGGPTGS